MRRHRTWGAGILLLILIVGAAPCLGQDPNVATVQREAMAKLEFLKGQWKGESWREFLAGQRTKAQGTETVEGRLDGLILIVEGVHRRLSADQVGEVDHQAFAVISYDEKEKRYRFQAYTGRGGYIDGKAKVTDKRLEWGFRISENTEMRYTITLNDRGQWFEIGEISRDGKEWNKVFEMTLERVKTP
jgi:hypothetical protein